MLCVAMMDSSKPSFASLFASAALAVLEQRADRLVVIDPVDRLRQQLGGEITIIDKRRKSGSQTEAKNIIGDVEGKNVLMVDDMITTAGTVTEACKILRDHGAKDIYMSATHAIFAPPAMERLANCGFTKLAVTDTIPIGARAEAVKDRLVVLGVAGLIGDAIHRIHHNESVSALFKGDPGDR